MIGLPSTVSAQPAAVKGYPTYDSMQITLTLTTSEQVKHASHDLI